MKNPLLLLTLFGAGALVATLVPIKEATADCGSECTEIAGYLTWCGGNSFEQNYTCSSGSLTSSCIGDSWQCWVPEAEEWNTVWTCAEDAYGSCSTCAPSGSQCFLDRDCCSGYCADYHACGSN